MAVCPLCAKRIFAYNLVHTVEETEYGSGSSITYEYTCIHCANAIRVRNNLYRDLSSYFDARPDKLAAMRQEHTSQEVA